MITLHIDEFADYDFKTVYQYLMLQQETSFEILIPKVNVLDKDDKFFVFLDYYLAAYAGQMLNGVASVFSYYVPSVYQVTDFRFQLETPDVEKLADVLYDIVQGYYDPSGGDEEISFYEKASDFHTDAWDNLHGACWGLIRIAAELME